MFYPTAPVRSLFFIYTPYYMYITFATLGLFGLHKRNAFTANV